MIAFESATASPSSAAALVHVGGANWVGITAGLTVGVLGGLSILMS